MKCAKCWSPDHTTEQCKVYAPSNERKVKCPDCWSSVTAAELALHKSVGCQNVRQPQRIAEVQGDSR